MPAAKCSYLCFQPERGEGTGTPHLQGFVCFEVRKKMSTVQNLLGRGVKLHLEVPKGTPQQNRDYCSKPETRDDGAGFGFHERGDLPPPLAPGKRNDLLAVKEKLDAGEHLWSISQSDPTLYGTILRNHRALSTYETHVAKQRDYPTALHIFEGSPGTFKSNAAFKWPSPYTLEQGNSGTWFDGYEPNVHESVILDEFHGGVMPYTTLKKLADRYPMMVETKGGRVIFRGKRIVITSNIAPTGWYPKYPFDSLERRITSWFCHSVTEAPIHGQPTGTTLITKKRGTWGMHPMCPWLVPLDGVPNDDVRRLNTEAILEEFDTEPVQHPDDRWA